MLRKYGWRIMKRYIHIWITGLRDGSGAVLGRSTANTGKGLADDSSKKYAFGMVLTYDEHGDLDVKVVKSSEKTRRVLLSERL